MAPTIEEMDRMLTEKEAGALIGMKPQTMAKWRMAGNPNAPAFCRVGRSCRYKLSTLRQWMASRKEFNCTQQAA
jgi:predicted DNA-binding transcriptional regulator AlpA